MAYGARLESVLGESPRGFESPILRTESPSDSQPPNRRSTTWHDTTTTHHTPSTAAHGGISMASTTTAVLVRPRRSLVATAFISIVLGMLPVFGVLYWFGVQHGSWMLVLIVHLVIAVVAVATMLRQLTVFTAVSATELSGRGIFSPVERVRLDRIASVTLVPTYIGQAPEPVQQLLVRDAAGHRLFRMRGTFWHPGDLAAVAAALPVATTVIKEPISIREFFRLYPGSAYWFENSPAVRVAVVVLAVLLVVAITLLIQAVFS